jgi:hypothetical protein
LAGRTRRKSRRTATTLSVLTKWLIWEGVAACVLLVILAGLRAAGVFIEVPTKGGGLLVVEVNEPNAEVFVDGERVTVKWGARRPEGRDPR